MFAQQLTRWLRLPGLARSPVPVWVTRRGTKPDVINVQRLHPRAAYYLVHGWVAEPHVFESVEQMFIAAGGQLVAHPVTVGDRTDPVIGAFMDGRLWLWQVPAIAVVSPAVFPIELAKPGEKAGGHVDRGVIEVRVVDEVGQPLPAIEVEIERRGKRTTQPTNGDGIVRITGVEESLALVWIKPEAPVREELRRRWFRPRGRPWLDTTTLPARSEIAVFRQETLPSATVFRDEPHTIILQPRVTQLVLHGEWFESGKAFVLPGAIEGVRFIVKESQKHPENDLLVVGHTDPTGPADYNDKLSLERAESTIAYLTDNIDAWHAWYGSEKPAEKRWGRAEDLHMVQALATETRETIPFGTGHIEWFQRRRGLPVDNVSGPATRRAIIQEYMQLRGTTLPPEARARAHGCGEHFPPPPSAATTEGEAPAALPRRLIEVFLFENPIVPPERPPGVLPEPPSDNSAAGSREYPEWVLRTRETLEHEDDIVNPPGDLHVSVLLRSNSGHVPPVGREFILHSGDGRQSRGTVGEDGRVEANGLYATDYLLEVDGVTVWVPAMPLEFVDRLTRIPGYYLYDYEGDS
jgi:outer membrane protein OmpA-like peptidoglycan-associated protein